MSDQGSDIETGTQVPTAGGAAKAATAGRESQASQRVPEVLQYLLGELMDIPLTLQLFLVDKGCDTPHKIVKHATTDQVTTWVARNPLVAKPIHWKALSDMRLMLIRYQTTLPPGAPRKVNSLVMKLDLWRRLFSPASVRAYYADERAGEQWEEYSQREREKLQQEIRDLEATASKLRQHATARQQELSSDSSQEQKKPSPRDSSADSSGPDTDQESSLHGPSSTKGSTTPTSTRSARSSPGKKIKHVSFAKASDKTTTDAGGGDDGSSSSSSSSLSSDGGSSSSSSKAARKKKGNKSKSSKASLADTLVSTLDRMSTDVSGATSAKPMVKLNLADIKEYDGGDKTWKPFFQSILSGFTLSRKGHLLNVRGKKAVKRHLKRRETDADYNLAVQDFFAILLNKTAGGTAHAQVEKYTSTLDGCLAWASLMDYHDFSGNVAHSGAAVMKELHSLYLAKDTKGGYNWYVSKFDGYVQELAQHGITIPDFLLKTMFTSGIRDEAYRPTLDSSVNETLEVIKKNLHNKALDAGIAGGNPRARRAQKRRSKRKANKKKQKEKKRQAALNNKRTNSQDNEPEMDSSFSRQAWGNMSDPNKAWVNYHREQDRLAYGQQ